MIAPMVERSPSNDRKAFEMAVSDPTRNMAVDELRIVKVALVGHQDDQECHLTPASHGLARHSIPRITGTATTFDNQFICKRYYLFQTSGFSAWAFRGRIFVSPSTFRFLDLLCAKRLLHHGWLLALAFAFSFFGSVQQNESKREKALYPQEST